MSNDLNDNIDDIFGGAISRDDMAAGVALAYGQQFKMHEEACKACRGTGRFVSYSGRTLGDCFKCKGKGKLYYRQSLAQREHARELKLRRDTIKRDSWNANHADECAWMYRKAARFEFARSMQEAVTKYGHLTDNQLAAVRKCMARDAEQKQQWATERAERSAASLSVDVSAISAAFAVAASNGLRRLSLRLDEFKFKPAPATGRNAGAIYVTSLTDTNDDGEALYLGKIANGKFDALRSCPAGIAERIVAAAANPKAAAIAYGKRTGSCCICARELTDPQSVEAGIGPICAEKYAF